VDSQSITTQRRVWDRDTDRALTDSKKGNTEKKPSVSGTPREYQRNKSGGSRLWTSRQELPTLKKRIQRRFEAKRVKGSLGTGDKLGDCTLLGQLGVFGSHAGGGESATSGILRVKTTSQQRAGVDSTFRAPIQSFQKQCSQRRLNNRGEQEVRGSFPAARTHHQEPNLLERQYGQKVRLLPLDLH